jgi:hypothetical protein
MRLRIHSVVIFLLIEIAVPAKSQPLSLVISEATQRLRDDDRRFILQTELQTESAVLTASQEAFRASPTAGNEEAVHRHIENVKALQRELDGAGRKQTRENPRVVVKATRPARNSTAAGALKTGSFWDPYNRAPDNTDFQTNQRREMP